MHIWFERTLCFVLLAGYLLLAWSISSTAFIVCAATTAYGIIAALVAAIPEPPRVDS